MGLSQVVGAMVYAWFLKFRRPSTEVKSEVKKTKTVESTLTKSDIVKTILKANASMILKQGSLLFTWAYATKCATRLGAEHVAAHQVALSFWMVFGYILDAVSVPAQVLLSKAAAARKTTSFQRGLQEMRSLTKYMVTVALAQGVLVAILMAGMSPYVPAMYTNDSGVITQLKTLLPILTAQQVLISLTFVMEALAAGGSQFQFLGIGTALSAMAAVYLMKGATSINQIWTGGILAMFVGRLAGASLGVLNANDLLFGVKLGKQKTV